MKIRKQRYALELITAVKTHPANARRGDIEAIEASIAANGFFGSVVAQSGTGLIVVGNHRHRAAERLKAKKIPVTWIECSDIEAERMAVADNRAHDVGFGNDTTLLLAQLNRIVAATDSLTGTGFTAMGLANLQAQADAAAKEALAGLDAPPSGFGEHAETLPPPPEAKPRLLDLVPVVKGAWRILHAQVLDALKEIPDNSIDAVLSDFPYGLGNAHPDVDELVAYLQGEAELDTGGDFMGRAWSVPSVPVHRELFRVLKPGGHIIGFASSRTGDLISMGMRAAGFEIRDVISWLYLSGFPKSHNISKALDEEAGTADQRPLIRTEERSNEASGIDDAGRSARSRVTRRITSGASELAKEWEGQGTALKPAYEPAILGRKPLEGTLAQNAAKWGVGGLAIDEARVGVSGGTRGENFAGTGLLGIGGKSDIIDIGKGRWPPNVIMDADAGAILDAQSGERKSTPFRENVATGDVLALSRRTAGGYSDTGGASRIFYSPKASRAERHRGVEHVENGGGHPTVKPVALARYLGTLLLPPPRADGTPRKLLVPYSGSGSDVIGALLAGWDDVTGIEREPQKPGDDDFVGIARARIAHAVAYPDEWCKPLEDSEDDAEETDCAEVEEDESEG